MNIKDKNETYMINNIEKYALINENNIFNEYYFKYHII